MGRGDFHFFDGWQDREGPPLRTSVVLNTTPSYMLHIIWSVIVGFIVGLLASAVMHTHMGFIGTTLLGIAGSVIGGLIARLFSRPPEGSTFHPAGFFMSILGAIVVVFLVRLVA